MDVGLRVLPRAVDEDVDQVAGGPKSWICKACDNLPLADSLRLCR